MNYSHLSLEERETIRVGLELGQSYRKIGKKLRRSHTTIGREFTRNQMHKGRSKSGEYIACKAQVKAQNRASAQRRKAPLKCPEVFLYVREHLREKWSPEAIAGRLTLEYPEHRIHHETIYRYIYSKPVRNRYKLWRYLTLSRRKRMSKGGRSSQTAKSIRSHYGGYEAGGSQSKTDTGALGNGQYEWGKV